MRAGRREDKHAGDLVALMAKKESFADVYCASSPVPYYQRYAPTRLSIVEYAAVLVGAINDLGLADGPVVDLGCGYGTLGVLLRTGLDIEGTYSTYLDARDVRVPAEPSPIPTVVGIDQSASALSAALSAGLIDKAVTMDLNSPRFRPSEFGSQAVAVCTAVLGYVRPSALLATLSAIRPRFAIVTCVTWLASEFVRTFRGQDLTIAKLNRRPLFQRWATPNEESHMAEVLIDSAHRAECFLLSTDPIPVNLLGERIETLRAVRGESAWLAAGRRAGCELRNEI